MRDTRDWSGDAHSAATSMFERAADQTGAFSEYTTSIGAALKEGSGTIGATRTALLNKADEIDMSGQLRVSDHWVVLITGAKLTAEQVAALERRAQAEQITVNGLLAAVGAADDDTAAKVAAAAKPHGFEAPDPTSLLPGIAEPSDEVPNPMTNTGLLQQALLRDADMAQTTRDEKVETQYDPVTGEEIATVTTLYMQDGSRHERTVNVKPRFRDRGPEIIERHFDKNNNPISETISVTFNERVNESIAGANVTTIEYADGTFFTSIGYPDGKVSATVSAPNRPAADVPLDLFSHPILSTASVGMSGLEAQAGRGIPMLTAEATEHIRIGAKYGGPGISVATALWDVAVAETGFQRCVAAAEGATSVGVGTLAGLTTSGAGPMVAIPVAIVASGSGQALGNWIGNTFCPR